MPRDPVMQMLEMILRADGGLMSVDRQADKLGELRSQSPDASKRVDLHLLAEMRNLKAGFRKLEATHARLEDLVNTVTATPWLPAVFIRHVDTSLGRRALASHGGTRRVVTIGPDVDAAGLKTGDEVYLSRELNVIVAGCSGSMPRPGETGAFERRTSDGRLVLKIRDEEVVVEAAAALNAACLKAGDLVQWDRLHWIAYEKMESSNAQRFFLEETPSESWAAIGGLDSHIAALERMLTLHILHRDVCKKWRLPRRKSVLFCGPPGNGKTMLARALANRLGTLSKSGRSRFLLVQPTSLHSMWYSESERQYRELFRLAREAGRSEPDVPVVIFFDEVDSIACHRGNSLMRVDDRIVTTLSAELQGLEDSGNILVLAATNRESDLDASLRRPGRLGDLVLHVERPGIAAAREIFNRHLPADVPYAGNGHPADSAALRSEIIEIVLSSIFSRNGDGELATIRFRDGKTRAVRRPDLISGAGIAKIARDATERACIREIEQGMSGLKADDLLDAVQHEFDNAAQTLTPGNCRIYIAGLPQDVDVVAVEAVVRRIKNPHRYVTLSEN